MMQDTFEVPQDATSRYLKLLTFHQFMREQNSEDEKLIRKFAPLIPVPEGWNVEDHLEDFHPGVWMRNGDHVIMVYGSMGMICALFGEMRKPAAGPTMETTPFTSSPKDQGEDFSMVFPVFPPEDIPYRDEDNDKDDFGIATKTLEDFMTGCIEYMSASQGGSDASTKKKSKDAKIDLGMESGNKQDDQDNQEDKQKDQAGRLSVSGPAISDFTSTGGRF